MIRQRDRFPIVVLLMIGTIALGAQQPAPFTTKTNLVVVPAVVLDQKDTIVAGLTAADFIVTEDGVPVKIETFVAPQPAGSPDESRFVVIVLDNLHMEEEIFFRVKGIARRFVDRMGPRDVATVIAINGGKSVTTSSKAELNAAINKFVPQFGDSIRSGQENAQHGLNMIKSLTEQMTKAPQPRKVLVFLGSPAMFEPSVVSSMPNADAMMAPEWTDAVQAAARNNVSVYSISPGGVGEGFAEWALSFADDTGGYAWSNTNNFGGAVDQIWRESASYYLIGYAPPVNDQKLHKIEVKVAKPGVKVRARRQRG
jgi:VWFA-related protein